MKHDTHHHKPCNIAKTLRIIGSKWTALLLHNLFDGKKRFGELQQAMPGISPKTLTQRLRELEDHGIISKKVFAEVPPHVEYTLTKRGKSLEEIFITMAQWGEQN